MAIPIPWPSSDDAEESYRSLDILLEQLLATVRQVMLQRRRQQQQELSNFRNSRQRTMNIHFSTVRPTEPFPEATSETPAHSAESRLPLPDLVQELVTDCEGSRRKAPTVTPVEAASSQVSTWVQVGAELRRIADSFRAERATEQNTMDAKSRQAKEASLLSLLSPALGRSVWTTLALILSWGLYNRTR